MTNTFNIKLKDVQVDSIKIKELDVNISVDMQPEETETVMALANKWLDVITTAINQAMGKV